MSSASLSGLDLLWVEPHRATFLLCFPTFFLLLTDENGFPPIDFARELDDDGRGDIAGLGDLIAQHHVENSQLSVKKTAGLPTVI